MSPEFIALSREAGLAAEGMASGATLLGKANAWQDAWYSHAFLALSIGFERSAKLAIVLDHYIETNGRFPTDTQLRAYSHDISSLIMKAEEISNRRRPNGRYAVLPTTLIHHGIIGTLSVFAKTTRYYNLDLLAQSGNVAIGDPLAMWSTRVGQPILAVHYRSARRARDEQEAAFLEHLIGENAMVRQHTETGELITAIGEGRMHAAQGDVIRKWSQFYTMQIARFLGALIGELAEQAQELNLGEDIPFLSEFFVVFTVPDAYLKTRKTWSAMGG